ncbi:YdcA family protein [Bartonella sp. LJL80]
MKQFFIIFIIFSFALPLGAAANTPCSGRKGGISHCQGATFVCNDGSISASRKNCSVVMGGGASNFMGGGATTPDMAPSVSGDCSCRSGRYCTGPRGGQFCYTDGGQKSYLRRN